MLKVLVISLFSLILLSCQRAIKQADLESNVLIIGGTPSTPKITGHASTVALLKEGAPHCTGTLIAEQLILTAAHCLEVDLKDLTISFADQVTEGKHTPQLERKVIEFQTFHKDKARFFPNWDIGWVKFEGNAPEGFAPAEILRNPDELIKGRPLRLIGYGRTHTICPANDLQCAGEKRMVMAKIKQYLDDKYSRSLLVTESNPNFGACNGDSGGPAFVDLNGHPYLVGVLSGNEPRYTPEAFLYPSQSCEAGTDIYGFPGNYLDWIQSSSKIALNFTPENPAATAPPALDRSESSVPFVQECERNDLSDEEWYTINSILLHARTLDCAQGAIWLAAQETIDFSGDGLRDLRPLRFAPQLRELNLERNEIRDISFVKNLPHLIKLNLALNRQIRDITSLSKVRTLRELKINHLDAALAEQARTLTQLSSLSIYGIKLTSLPCYSRLIHLKELNLGFTPIADLSALQCVPGLETLHARFVAATQFDSLIYLPNLKHLNLGGNFITNTSDLTLPTMLEHLELADAKLQSIQFLTLLKQLRILDINNLSETADTLNTNPMFTAPATLEKLSMRGIGLSNLNFLRTAHRLTHLDAAVNLLTELQPLATLKKLKVLNLLGNAIIDASIIGRLKQLEELNLSSNAITNADFVAELQQLRSLEIGWNQLTAVESLSKATKLTFLDLSQNPLTTITKLSDLVNLLTLRILFWDVPESEKRCPFTKPSICEFTHPQ